ncbi:unnamed protein product [Camellia sinensis]
MVLLLVSGFRKKFSGILSEKETLGSKHLQPEGHGVFREFCKHDSCGYGNEPNYDKVKLVVLIINFIGHYEATWMKMLLEWETNFELTCNSEKYSRLPCEGLSHNQFTKRILHSEDMGVVLIGQAKISPSSGRLQLIDVTGSIDVIIPDLPSTWNINNIYEVNEFSLVMEGIPEKVDCSGLHLNESFLDTKLRNQPFHSCIKGNGNFDELQSGRFHLLLVTHKYPVQQKLLRICGYYIIKHHDEDMLHSVEDVNDVSCGVRINSILRLALDFYSIQQALISGGAVSAIKARCEMEVDWIEKQFDDCTVFLLKVLSFKLNVGHFPHLADLVTRINYNYFYMSENGNLITAPVSETISSKMGKAFANSN